MTIVRESPSGQPLSIQNAGGIDPSDFLPAGANPSVYDCGPAISRASTIAQALGSFISFSAHVFRVAGNLTIQAPAQYAPTARIQPTGTVTINEKQTPAGDSTWHWDRSAGGNFVFAPGTLDAVRPKNFGALGDDSNDDTLGIETAVLVANQVGKNVQLGKGTFLTDTITGVDGVTRYMQLDGEGKGVTILKSLSGNHVIEITALSVGSISIQNLSIDGNSGGANNGIYFHDNVFPPDHTYLRGVRIENCGNNAVNMKEMFNSLFIDVGGTNCGSDFFDLDGDNTLTMINCYADSVTPGKVIFRIRSGLPTLIGCNGTGGGGDWGKFGDAGPTRFCKPTLIGCNIEDFGAIGLHFLTGSYAEFKATTVVAPAAGTVTAMLFDSANGASHFDSTCSITTKGAAWTNGQAIHTDSGGIPFILSSLTSGITQYRQDSDGSVFDLPYINSKQVGSTQIGLKVGPGLAIGDGATVGYFLTGTADPVNPPTGSLPAIFLRTDAPNQKFFVFLNGAWTQMAVP